MEEGNQSPLVPQNTFFAALISGICNPMATQPIDCIKTRQQIAKLDPLAPKYTNVFRLKALYRGLPPSLLSVSMSYSIFFPTYENLRNKISSKTKFPKEHPISVVPSVVSSWLISSIFVAPISKVKVKLQTQKEKIGLIQTMKIVIKEEGFKGLYSGYKGTLMFSFLFAIHFGLFEHLKKKVNDIRMVPFISGFTSGLACLITYPNDVILSRILYQGKQKKYNGFIDAYKKSIQQNGWKSLYVGLSTSLSRFVIGSIVTFSVYEYFK